MNLIATIASKIKTLRKRAGIRQSTLADQMGISLRHFQSIESGTVDIKSSTIGIVAEALGVPPCYLSGSIMESYDPAEFPCMIELLDCLHVGIQLTDLQGRVIFANRLLLETHGFTKQDIVRGLFCWDFLYGPDASCRTKESIDKIVQQRPAPTPIFAKYKSEEGDLVPVKIDWRYHFGRNGKISHFVSVITYHPSW